MRRGRLAGLITGWMVLWAVALGAWFVAPRLLEVQRLRPVTAGQWAWLDAVLLACLALAGLVLSLPASALTIAWTLTRRRPLRSRAWFAAVSAPLLLGVGYVAVGWAFVRTAFGPAIAFRLYVPAVEVLGAIAAGVTLPLVAFYRAWCDRRGRAPIFAAASIAVVAVAGFLLLPLRVVVARAACAPAPSAAPARAAVPGAERPLLFVGIDSGNWPTLEPLLVRDRVPTLARLIRAGVRGRMHAAWPPYWSSPAWAAMLTGYGPSETGIYQDRIANATGLPAFIVSLDIDPLLIPMYGIELALLHEGAIEVEPPSREMLGRVPVWELLEAHGVRTAVIRFDFTYPADNEASVVVSNRVGGDAWDLLDSRRAAASGLVWPREEASALLKPYAPVHRDPDPAEWAALKPADPRRMPRDAIVDPQHAMHLAYDIDRESFDSAEQIIASHPDVRTIALYLGGFDVVCHAFWQYRFPDQYPGARPDERDIARLGGEIDAYLEFLDRHLARLLDRVGGDADVVIVSDHGHEATDSRPMWRGWHGPEGIFIAAGPSFPHRDDPIDVSYFAIAPTLLALEHVPVAASMPGRPLPGLAVGTATARATSGRSEKPQPRQGAAAG